MPLSFALNATNFVEVCGQLAPLFAITQSISPIPTIQEIQRDKSVKNYPLLPYSSMVANAFLWSMYGLLKSEPKVWLSNTVGLLFAVLYALVYIRYSPKVSPILPGSIRQHMGVLLSIMVATFVLVCRNAVDSVGLLGVFICIAMFGSPLSSLSLVLREKSAKSIPISFAVVSGINCFLWSVSGWFSMKDWNIYFPSMLGLSFSLAQIGLKLLYGDGVKTVDTELAV